MNQKKRQVTPRYNSLLANLYGSDKLVLRAGKLEALQFMRSERLEERVLAPPETRIRGPYL
jgi:ATP-dependent Lon protease